MTYAAVEAVRKDVARMIRPRVRMRVSEAAQKYVKVRTPSGGVGAWDPDETPYMVEPMDCLSQRQYETVIFVGPSRTGKTQALLDSWIAYMIKCEPCTMQVVHMTEFTARKYSRRRIDRLHRDSPTLKKEIAAGAHNDNTYDKYYRSGNVLGISWPSVTNLSGDDVKFIGLTDYDRFPDDIGGEGSGYFLAKKRTQTFGTRGMTLIESSPGKEINDPKWQPGEDAPHEAPPTAKEGVLSLYNMGDRRRLYWKCPECGEWFMMQSGLDAFSYNHEKDTNGLSDPQKIGDVGYVCSANGCVIDRRLQRELNKTAIWVPEGCRIENNKVVGNRRNTRIASFWMTGAAAAYQDAESIIEKYMNALRIYEQTGEESSLKTITNTDLGLPYLPMRLQNQVSADDYYYRAEELPERMVPQGVRFLVAAVDVQKHRFVVQVLGYGVGMECWIIDRFDIHQSKRVLSDEVQPINPAAYLEDWLILVEKIITRRYPLADGSGRDMGVLITSCDSGGREGVTEKAYQFWKEMRRRNLSERFMLVKGERSKPEANKPMVTLTHPDKTSKAAIKAKVVGQLPLWILNTTALKDSINGHLQRVEPGPDYVHFPDWLGRDFYEELTAETRTEKGWENPSRSRNESFDLMCYSKAALLAKLTRHYQSEIDWNDPPIWAQDWNTNSEIYGAVPKTENDAQKPKQSLRRVRMRMRR